jgi:hypothetical protein
MRIEPYYAKPNTGDPLLNVPILLGYKATEDEGHLVAYAKTRAEAIDRIFGQILKSKPLKLKASCLCHSDGGRD